MGILSKSKSFDQIVGAFTKPIAELEAFVTKKREQADSAIAAARMHEETAQVLRDDAATLHAEADEAGAFKTRLQDFLNPPTEQFDASDLNDL